LHDVATMINTSALWRDAVALIPVLPLPDMPLLLNQGSDLKPEDRERLFGPEIKPFPEDTTPTVGRHTKDTAFW